MKKRQQELPPFRNLPTTDITVDRTESQVHFGAGTVWLFERRREWQRLAAVDGGVADVLALDDVDDVFGDVGGVVADAL